MFDKWIDGFCAGEGAVDRAKVGKKTSLVGIGCNLTLFAIKLVAGLLSGSLAVAADAVNNLSDASSSVISLLGFQMGSKPADAEHPYGHGRYEYLAGLSVAVLILVIGVELLKTSVQRTLHPEPVDFTVVTGMVLVVSILIKAAMQIFYHKVGQKIDSNTLEAAAADSRNDVLTTTGVLLGMLVTYFTSISLDGPVGLAVAAFILYSGFGLIRDTLDPLLGHAPEPEEVETIRQKILGYPGVIGTHDLLIHDYGPGRQFASAHVEMSAATDPLQAHEVIDQIERDFLEEKGLNMVVHMDPVAEVDTALGQMNEWLATQVRTIDAALTVHDLRVMTEEDGRTLLEFDCVVPRGFGIPDEALRSEVTRLVQQRWPRSDCRITVDHDYAALPHTAER